MTEAAIGILDAIARDAPFFTALRRDLHANPELSFQEERTSALVEKSLLDFGVRVHRGFGGTGLIGVVRKGTSSRSIGLRADMDALPITERNGFAHASKRAGVMHACGHDGHTAMLLAAAKHLGGPHEFDGTVYLIFQPAEESGGGAREMIKHGLFERFPMDAVFGMHNWPGLPAGEFAIRSGPVFAASNEFKIRVRGKGTHAAMPHGGIDPLLAACQLVQTLQTIVSRNIHPVDPAVVSVTMIQSGVAPNVIPDVCELQGTVRAFSMAVVDAIERRMREISEHTCAALGATCEFEFMRKYPPTCNHGTETEFVRQVLVAFAGAGRVREFESTLGAEDFSYYLLEKPGCYFLIGNGDGRHRAGAHGEGACTLHSPSYDFNDDLIGLGASMWVKLVDAWLAPVS